MKIDHELVKKLAHLARLEVSSEEEGVFAEQLPAIVEYVGALQAAELGSVPTESTPDTAQRIDEVHGRSTRESILVQAPVRQDDFWKVDSVKG
jgi:aspartyl-tRNA(Asn)/glutamyl-tRNA(Gln) amidotransferase subunit C